MTAPRLADARAATAAFARLADALRPLFVAVQAAFRALVEAFRWYAVAMNPALAQYHPSASPRIVRRRRQAALIPSQRAALRRERRTHRRWLRHLGRRPR